MIRDIVENIKALETPCQPCPEPFASGIVEELIDTASLWQRRPCGCVGLAANQIGYPYQVVVIWHCGNWMPMINPVINVKSPEVMEKKEGCLSFPGIRKKMKRHKKITVTFNTPKKKDPITVKYTGMTARIIQHEIDHLMGRHI